MPEPKFDAYMRPILEIMRDGQTRKTGEIKPLTIAHMGFRKEDFT